MMKFAEIAENNLSGIPFLKVFLFRHFNYKLVHGVIDRFNFSLHFCVGEKIRIRGREEDPSSPQDSGREVPRFKEQRDDNSRGCGHHCQVVI